MIHFLRDLTPSRCFGKNAMKSLLLHFAPGLPAHPQHSSEFLRGFRSQHVSFGVPAGGARVSDDPVCLHRRWDSGDELLKPSTRDRSEEEDSHIGRSEIPSPLSVDQ